MYNKHCEDQDKIRYGGLVKSNSEPEIGSHVCIDETESNFGHMQIETGVDISKLSSLSSNVSSEMATLTRNMERVITSGRDVLKKGQSVHSFPERYRLDNSRLCVSDLDAKVSNISSRRSFDAIPSGNTALLRAIYPANKSCETKYEVMDLSARLHRLDSELKVSKSELRESLRSNVVLKEKNDQLRSELMKLCDELQVVKTSRRSVVKKQIEKTVPVPVVFHPSSVSLEVLQERIRGYEESEANLRRTIEEMTKKKPLNFFHEIHSCVQPTQPVLQTVKEMTTNQTSCTVVCSTTPREVGELSIENNSLRRKLMLSLYREKQCSDSLSELKLVHESALSDLTLKSNQIKSIQNNQGPFLRKIRQLSSEIDSLNLEIVDLKKKLLKRSPIESVRIPPTETFC